MLEIVQFENGRYGLMNVITGVIIDKEWRTIFFANRARHRQSKKPHKSDSSFQ